MNEWGFSWMNEWIRFQAWKTSGWKCRPTAPKLTFHGFQNFWPYSEPPLRVTFSNFSNRKNTKSYERETKVRSMVSLKDIRVLLDKDSFGGSNIPRVEPFSSLLNDLTNLTRVAVVEHNIWVFESKTAPTHVIETQFRLPESLLCIRLCNVFA